MRPKVPGERRVNQEQLVSLGNDRNKLLDDNGPVNGKLALVLRWVHLDTTIGTQTCGRLNIASSSTSLLFWRGLFAVLLSGCDTIRVEGALHL